jgi:hypothetical protein
VPVARPKLLGGGIRARHAQRVSRTIASIALSRARELLLAFPHLGFRAKPLQPAAARSEDVHQRFGAWIGGHRANQRPGVSTLPSTSRAALRF